MRSVYEHIFQMDILMNRASYLLLCLLFVNAGLAGAAGNSSTASPSIPADRFNGSIPRPWALRLFDAKTDGLIGGEIRTICESGDTTWFAGQQGVCRYDGINWERFETGPTKAPTSANVILKSEDGAIWVGSEQGVSRFEDKNWTTYKQVDGLPGSVVKAICQTEDGTIWVGCGTRGWLPKGQPGGLAKWDGEKWTALTEKDGLVHRHVNDLYELKDRLWIATDGGVSRYDYNDRNWTSYKTSDRFHGKKILTIYQDKEGGMWFGTEEGVVHFAEDIWTYHTIQNAPRTGKWTPLSRPI